MNGKISWQPTAKSSLHTSFYAGDDQLSAYVFEDKNFASYSNRWGNVMSSFRYKQILNAEMKFDNTLSYTRYRIKDIRSNNIDTEVTEIDNYRSTSLSSVKDFSFKSDWIYNVARPLKIEFGFHNSYLSFLPYLFSESSNDEDTEIQTIRSNEFSYYIDNKIYLKRALLFTIGFRGVYYSSVNYSRHLLEPRLNVKLSLLEDHVFSFSYFKVNQFSHMLFSSGSFLMNELWIPCGAGIEPSSSKNYSIGWEGYFSDGLFSVELELYRKEMYNLLDYKEGYSSLRGDVMWQSKIESGGIGQSKGIEFSLNKQRGDWKGFLSYTYSSTTRQFESINSGLPYVYDYDRPHCFSMDIDKKINDKWSVNVLWVYQSGLPYTPAIARAYVPYRRVDDINYTVEALIYGSKNSARMRPYHRMDLGLKYNTKSEKGRKVTWSISVYNLYNRKNPYFYYYNTKPELSFGGLRKSEDYQKLYQFSFFPVIPSVSYQVDF